MAKKARAVFYARVSTEHDEQLNSIELQIEENKEAIDRNGWELVDWYVDRGKSGRQVKGRDEYQRLLDDMELNKFDIICVKDQDRLMRNTKDWYIFVDRLVVNRLELFFYLDNRPYTPDNALITGIRAIIAEDFSRNLSKKLTNFNDRRIEKAKAKDKNILLQLGKAYGWDQKNGVVTLNPEQAKVRRLMCELTLQGKGSTEVAKILNDGGYRNTVGNEWRVSDIPRMVYDHLNVGTVILNQKRSDFDAKRFIYTDPSEWVYLEDVIPAIVSKEEWERLQEIRKERTTVDRRRGKKAGRSNCFSGKLTCGCCGATYWRKTKKNDPDDEFWVCSTKQTKGRMTRAVDAVGGKKGEHNPQGCDNVNITTKALMEMLEVVTVKFTFNPELIKADRVKWLEGLKKSILEANNSYTEADMKREKARKDKLLSGFMDGFISGEDYAEQSKKIDDKMKLIQKDLKAEEGKLEDIAEIDKVLANIDDEIAKWLDGNNQLKMECMLEQMSGVVIYPDGIRIRLKWLDAELVVEKIQYVRDRNARQ